MNADSHLGIAAELLKTHAFANEPKLLLAAIEEVRLALREARSASPLSRAVERILAAYRESPMVFCRQGKLVICDRRYRTETLDGQRVSQFIASAREELGDHERKLFAGR